MCTCLSIRLKSFKLKNNWQEALDIYTSTYSVAIDNFFFFFFFLQCLHGIEDLRFTSLFTMHNHMHATELPKLNCTFTGSEHDCEILFNVLSDTNLKLFDHANIIEAALYSDGTKTGFKPLVLLPGRIMCCDKKVIIRLVYR